MIKSNRIASLAINQEGFVFDPATGQSFRVNTTGMRILKALSTGVQIENLVREIASGHDLDEKEAERDVLDFIDQLRIFKLM